MTTEINLRSVKVSNVVEWPNRLGLNATANGIRFEIWKDGRFVRMAGSEGAFYHDSIFLAGGLVTQDLIDITKVAYALWMGAREEWVACN